MPFVAGVNAARDLIFVYINPALIKAEKLTMNDVIEILKHEYAHVILHHCWVRLPEKINDNIAADIEINQLPWVELDKSTFIKDKGMTYEKFKLEDSKSREWYYNHLPKGNGKGKGKGKGKNGTNGYPAPGSNEGDNEGDNSGSTIDSHETWKPDDIAEDTWRQIVQEMIEQAKSQGTLGGDMVEYIESKWKKFKPLDQVIKRVIQKHISQAIEEGQTRTRPSRRYPMLPGVKDMYGPKIVWAIDTSGSMSTKELQIITGVMRWLHKRIKFDLIQCDAGITDVKIGGRITAKLAVKGRGGTDFRPVFKWIEDKYKSKIDLLIYATDLQGTFPDNKPPYQTVWLATEAGEVPFGKKILIRPEAKREDEE
jgi:predicted metal-dependent peptidase